MAVAGFDDALGSDDQVATTRGKRLIPDDPG